MEKKRLQTDLRYNLDRENFIPYSLTMVGIIKYDKTYKEVKEDRQSDLNLKVEMDDTLTAVGWKSFIVIWSDQAFVYFKLLHGEWEEWRSLLKSHLKLMGG